MERMAADPMASVPKACQGWGETMGAYRFFDNDKVEWHAILEPHWQQTQERMRAHPVILCLQDTTELLRGALRKSSDAGCILMRSSSAKSM